MVEERSVVNYFNLEILLGFTLIFAIGISQGFTNPSDALGYKFLAYGIVAAINSFYVALGSPSLSGWTATLRYFGKASLHK